MQIVKSIGAVLFGFLTVAVLSVATDAVLEHFGVLPRETDPTATTTWMLALALLYRSFYTVLGGYLTAKFAPNRKMAHVVVLMVLGAIGGIAGAIGGWNLSNHWYPVALAVTGPLFVWLGGKLMLRNSPVTPSV